MDIKENIIKAIAVLDSIPDSAVDLHQYWQTAAGNCGTLACAAGWLTTDPHFKKLGMGLVLAEERLTLVDTHSPVPFTSKWLDRLFGESAFAGLFAGYGEGSYDPELLGDHYLDLDKKEYEEKVISDKQLAIARLKRQLIEIA